MRACVGSITGDDSSGEAGASDAELAWPPVEGERRKQRMRMRGASHCAPPPLCDPYVLGRAAGKTPARNSLPCATRLSRTFKPLLHPMSFLRHPCPFLRCA